MSRDGFKVGSHTFEVDADTGGEGQTIRPALLWVFRSENRDACRNPKTATKEEDQGRTGLEGSLPEKQEEISQEQAEGDIRWGGEGS